jgi:hypothetical protein
VSYFLARTSGTLDVEAHYRQGKHSIDVEGNEFDIKQHTIQSSGPTL